MNKWYQIFHKNTGLSPYVWIVFCILPFYYIFQFTFNDVVSGFVLIILFFICYRLSFVSKGWLVYFWTSVQIIISIVMILQFSYVYFSIFLAFFIGNIQNRAGFFTLYSIHIISTIATVNYGFAIRDKLIFAQFPFVLISLIVVILLPFNTYNRNKQERLEGLLEDANKRISELVKLEERQRIARDLHDTLGQKLSLIGLKSDLAGKLVTKNPSQAQDEMKDVHQTARAALKEVREMVTEMRGTKLEDELFRIQQILKAAEIEFRIEGELNLSQISLMSENVLSMCLKEAVTNIVKHSGASVCTIVLEPSRTEFWLKVKDDGIGMAKAAKGIRGNGLSGMKERLEFVNGSLEVVASDPGVTLLIRVPNAVSPAQQDA